MNVSLKMQRWFWAIAICGSVGVAQFSAYAQEEEGPACGDSCQVTSFFKNNDFVPPKIMMFNPNTPCRRLWQDTPNDKDAAGAIEVRTATQRIAPTCAATCPDAWTGDVIVACNVVGTQGSVTADRNCYVTQGGVAGECVPRP